MDIKVLGTGCSKCKSTVALIQDVAGELGVAIELEKVEDFTKIATYGIMSTPGVVVNGKVVHAGGIPKREVIETWLKA